MRTTMARLTTLNEDDSDVGGGIALSPNSVDTQIDSLLVSFENESQEVDDDVVFPEGRSMRSLLMLLEEEGEDESGADDVTSDAEQKTDEPAEPLTPKVNIDEFATRVAALIETYTKRLDVETVIFNRARNYLVEEHGDDVARKFEDILVTEHDIDLREKVPGEEDDIPPDPHAVGGMGPVA